MKQRKSEINWKLVVRVACLMLLDVMLLYLACLLALLSRFDLSIHTLMRDSGFLPALHAAFPWVAIGMIALFIPLKLYSSLWEFAGVEELLHILCACFLFAAATLLLILFGVLDLPRSFPVLAGLYLVALLSASRFSYRLIRTILHRSGSEKRKKRTMLIGAGSAGMLVLREFQTSENSQNNVVCVIDDDRDKLGKYIRNVKIAGTRDDIVALAQSRRIEEIVLAIPTAAVRERRNILQLCQKTGCRLKILPGIYQLANGEVNIQKIRNVDVQDLLGRDCVKVDLSQIAGYLSGKTILVTGGGGSIGSELCRQIARHTPKRLVLLDIYENNAYAIEQELHRTHPELDLAVCIGSVRDEMRVSSLFAQYRPDIVFHAAAHKHVPLMEGSPNEAIKNNVFGTLHVAQAADRYGTETFVLISTDKAVNPTNVMGASKRVPAAARFSCWIWASRSALTIWPATSSVFPALSRTWISRSAIPACAPVRSSMKRCSCRKRGFAPRRTISSISAVRWTSTFLPLSGSSRPLQRPAGKIHPRSGRCWRRSCRPITQRQAEDRPRTCHKCREETQRYERRDTPACISYSTS